MSTDLSAPAPASTPPGVPVPDPARVRVTYRMTDQMGVVYYANYLELFEIGRTELLRATGFSYNEMENDGYQMPVLHASCDYLSPARYDDLLEITARVELLTRLRLDILYEVRRVDEERVLARGRTRHTFIDGEGRPRRLSPLWLERIRNKLPGAADAAPAAAALEAQA